MAPVYTILVQNDGPVHKPHVKNPIAGQVRGTRPCQVRKSGAPTLFSVPAIHGWAARQGF